MSPRVVMPGTVLGVFLAVPTGPAAGARLVEVRPVDDEHLMIRWLDGEVRYQDDGQGPTAFLAHEHRGQDEVIRYDPPLDTGLATDPGRYALAPLAVGEAVRPVAAFRKSKVNGSPFAWPEPEYTLEHTVYLRLPVKLQSGTTYRLTIDPAVNTDTTAAEFTFDLFSSVSEAIHVNRLGYLASQTAIKSADLYCWMGDGAGRDYSSYEGHAVWLVDVATGARHRVGEVAFWKAAGPDFGTWNATASPVWTCDFTDFTTPGRYRLAIEGIGCSPDFELRDSIYREPYRTSLRGFYYMRIGEPFDGNDPPPRQPPLIPGANPPGFRVVITEMSPWHPEWRNLPGDAWDVKDWSAFVEPGEPTNPRAIGGHADACDWDRHLGHIAIVWDLLLPYVLTGGRLGDDDLGIRESGNGIPDLLDEARNEVDFWLNLRDPRGGYASGTNNPPGDHSVLYQAAARPYMAWASAANAAMLAHCLHLAGHEGLADEYRVAAEAAWAHAAGEDLDFRYSIGNGAVRGRDLKQLAAAYLYCLTGQEEYETAFVTESRLDSPTAEVDLKDQSNQLWATAGYLMCAKYGWQPIRWPERLATMTQAVVHEALRKNVAHTDEWPTRRSADPAYGWFQTTTEVQRLCLAHAVSDDAATRQLCLRAMLLEADYGLGRNPLNMVLMTGLGDRHPERIYTTGRNDGVPGVHPGHTPYMNAEPWGRGFMADPRWYSSKGYPEWARWPHGEALWNTPYCYSNNEFTPQQTMRGKMVLLAYLHAVGTGAR